MSIDMRPQLPERSPPAVAWVRTRMSCVAEVSSWRPKPCVMLRTKTRDKRGSSIVSLSAATLVFVWMTFLVVVAVVASFGIMEGTVGAFLRVAEEPDKVVKVGVFFVEVVEEERGMEDLR